MCTELSKTCSTGTGIYAERIGRFYGKIEDSEPGWGGGGGSRVGRVELEVSSIVIQ